MRRIAICLALMVWSHPLCAADDSGLKVRLRSPVDISTTQAVTVGDIATLTGPADAARTASRVLVAPRPVPGQTRRIERSYVVTKLASVGLKNAAVSGAPAVLVTGKCVSLSPEDMCDQAKAYLLSVLPSEGRTYELSVQRMPRALVLPEGEVEVRPRLLSAPRLGVNAVAIDAVMDGKTAATTSAVLDVKAVAEVLVATQNIRQGAEVNESNATWGSRDITKTPNVIARSGCETPQTLVARRTIGAGSIITTSDVEPPFSIRRGDKVSVIARCGRVTLRTTGEARQDGRAGDTIHVTTAVSQGEVRGRITGEGSVEVLQ